MPPYLYLGFQCTDRGLVWEKQIIETDQRQIVFREILSPPQASNMMAYPWWPYLSAMYRADGFLVTGPASYIKSTAGAWEYWWSKYANARISVATSDRICLKRGFLTPRLKFVQCPINKYTMNGALFHLLYHHRLIAAIGKSARRASDGASKSDLCYKEIKANDAQFYFWNGENIVMQRTGRPMLHKVVILMLCQQPGDGFSIVNTSIKHGSHHYWWNARCQCHASLSTPAGARPPMVIDADNHFASKKPLEMTSCYNASENAVWRYAYHRPFLDIGPELKGGAWKMSISVFWLYTKQTKAHERPHRELVSNAWRYISTLNLHFTCVSFTEK